MVDDDQKQIWQALSGNPSPDIGEMRKNSLAGIDRKPVSGQWSHNQGGGAMNKNHPPREQVANAKLLRMCSNFN